MVSPLRPLSLLLMVSRPVHVHRPLSYHRGLRLQPHVWLVWVRDLGSGLGLDFTVTFRVRFRVRFLSYAYGLGFGLRVVISVGFSVAVFLRRRTYVYVSGGAAYHRQAVTSRGR